MPIGMIKRNILVLTLPPYQHHSLYSTTDPFNSFVNQNVGGHFAENLAPVRKYKRQERRKEIGYLSLFLPYPDRSLLTDNSFAQ